MRPSMRAKYPYGHPVTVAENFIKKYSRDRLLKLLEMIVAGEKGEAIAAEFGFTKARVSQLVKILGHQRMIYVIRPAVCQLLGLKSNPEGAD